MLSSDQVGLSGDLVTRVLADVLVSDGVRGTRGLPIGGHAAYRLDIFSLNLLPRHDD
jgi:hypothetical protein